MNRLQLCQRLCIETGIPNQMTSAVDQTGEYLRVVGWVDAAWEDIQSAHQDWEWMRASTSFVTVEGQHQYALGTGAGTAGVAAASFGAWVLNSFRNYPTASGNTTEIPMSWMNYDEWRDTYLFGGTRSTRSRPVVAGIGPDKAINLGPVPAAGYTVTGDYYSAPLAMSADTDIPGLPTQFHLAIVYRAMMFYAGFESASEVYQRGETEFAKIMRRLTVDRLPMAGFAGPLA